MSRYAPAGSTCIRSAGSLSVADAYKCRPLPWWRDETEAGLMFDVQQLSAAHANSAYLEQYNQQAANLFIYTSNQSEGTLPEGFSLDDTNKVLQHTLGDAVDSSERCSQTWYDEGGRTNSEGAAQLMQHMKALRFLCYQTVSQELDQELLLKAHAILMDGAVSSCGTVSASGYRLGLAHTDMGHVYMHPDSIGTAVNLCLDWLRNELHAARSSNHPCEVAGPDMAAGLFYRLIHEIHPFANGNGRFGKLLVARILMQLGTPFSSVIAERPQQTRQALFPRSDTLHPNWEAIAAQILHSGMFASSVDRLCSRRRRPQGICCRDSK